MERPTNSLSFTKCSKAYDDKVSVYDIFISTSCQTDLDTFNLKYHALKKAVQHYTKALELFDLLELVGSEPDAAAQIPAAPGYVLQAETARAERAFENFEYELRSGISKAPVRIVGSSKILRALLQKIEGAHKRVRDEQYSAESILYYQQVSQELKIQLLSAYNRAQRLRTALIAACNRYRRINKRAHARKSIKNIFKYLSDFSGSEEDGRAGAPSPRIHRRSPSTFTTHVFKDHPGVDRRARRSHRQSIASAYGSRT